MTGRRSRSLGPNHKRAKSKGLTALQATQFALEQVVKEIGILKTQLDNLALLDKQRMIQANEDRIRMKELEKWFAVAVSSLKRLETRVYRSDIE